MNILLIQLRRLGDLILTTPAISAVRAKFPDAKITLAVTKECRHLLPAIGNVDEFVVVRRGPADIGEFGRVLRGNFDISIDFTGNDRSAFLTFLSHAGQRIAGDRRKLRESLRARAYNALVPWAIRESHTIDANLALLAPLGIDNADPAPSLALPDQSRRAASDLKRNYNLGDKFIIFHPGTARTEKFWVAERWAEVIRHVRQSNLGYRCVITGSDSDLEQSHIATIVNCRHPERSEAQSRDPVAKVVTNATGSLGFARDDGVVDLCGKLDLLTLAALISAAQLVVTVDSAPVHIAAAIGTPQVALFGPTNPFHWRPRTSPTAILTGESPAPITTFAPNTARTPMNRISTQQVIDAIDAVLPRPAVSPG